MRSLLAAIAITVTPAASLAQGYVYPNNNVYQPQYTPPSNPYQQYNQMLYRIRQQQDQYRMQQQINENTRYRMQQQY